MGSAPGGKLKQALAGETLGIAEGLMSTLVEQAPLTIQVFSPEGIAIQANAAWEQLWAVSRAEAGSYNILKDSQLKALGVLSQIRKAFRGETVALPAVLYDPSRSNLPGRARWVESWLYPLKDPAGRVENVILIQQDVTARKQGERQRSELLGRSEEARHQAEESERLSSFLADAGKVLASSLDCEQTLASVARLAVPRIADWFSVHLVEADGTVRLLASVHADAAKAELARDIWAKYPARPDDPVPHALRTGDPQLVSDVSDTLLRSLTPNKEHYKSLRKLDIRSYIVVPMAARGRMLGTLTLVNSGLRIPFGDRELEVAQDLAYRGALAIDNARFYESAMRDRAAAEAALQAQAESEERFRSLSTCSPVGKFMTDILGRCTWTNPRCQLICGFTAKESLGDGWLEFVHPDDRTEVAVTWRETIGRGAEYSQEARFVRPDSQERWVHIRSAPMVSSKGDLMGFVGTMEDITDNKTAEEELRRYNEDLQRFAFVASHDLKEPLRLVATYTQMLEKRYRGALDADADEFIRYIIEGVNRMRLLIDDLLTYSRLITTRGESMRTANCETVLDWALMNLQVAIQESGAEVTRSPLPVVAVDPVQVGQLFQNLIGNAIKYRSPQPPRIHVNAERRRDEWVFSVSDNGIGIDPEYRERIFGVFKRLHGREYPGTGIGLAICKRIVEGHGGRIWVESQIGKGATFRFTIPVLKEPADRAEAGADRQ